MRIRRNPAIYVFTAMSIIGCAHDYQSWDPELDKLAGLLIIIVGAIVLAIGFAWGLMSDDRDRMRHFRRQEREEKRREKEKRKRDK